MIMELSDSAYGDRQADMYDELFRVFGGEHVDEVVELLSSYAGSGKALELGVGTGRVAIPLTDRGIEMTGLDSSDRMLDIMRSKVGNRPIVIASGQMQHFRLQDQFSLVYCVSNTFLHLPSVAEQQACFRSVAEHLDRDGCFIVDAKVASLERFSENQAINIWYMDADTVHLEVSRLDPRTRRVDTQQVILENGRPLRLNPMKTRETTLAELDSYAVGAGLGLDERFATWSRDPYVDGCSRAISVYRRV